MEEFENNDRKELRNKMVSFMYLIFIVLAFLYIPADFIDTIRDINTSLEISSREMNEVKNYNLLLLKAGLKADSIQGKQKTSIDFNRISILTDSVYKELESLRQHILNTSGGFNKYGYLNNAKDNQFTDEIMLEKGAAKEIRKMLSAYKTNLTKAGSSMDALFLDSIIPTQELIKTSTGKSEPWEKFYFHKMPLTVSLALIAKFQNDIRKVEFMAMDEYLAELSKKYELALLDKKRKPKEKEKKPKENSLKLLDPEAYIRHNELNTLYININNPIKIYHPRIKGADITAEISKGKIYQKDSIYYARVNNVGIVNVNAFTTEGKKLLASEKFMVKNLPDPSAFIADRKGGIISSKIFRIQKNIDVRNEMINNSEDYFVKSFSLIKISGDSVIQKSKNNHGAFFNATTRELIDQAERGDLFIFDNIEVEVPGGSIQTVSSLVFTII